MKKFKSKEYKSALIEINKAIEIDRKNAALFNLRGSIKYNLGNTKGACSDFNKALTIINSERKDPIDIQESELCKNMSN
mgnify:CR=1 FL=1